MEHSVKYLKNNFNLLPLILRESFSKPVFFTTIYLFVVYMLGLYTIYTANEFDISSQFQPAVLASLKYIFTLVFPIASFILLSKYRETGRFLIHLKSIFYPLIKFEIIIYLLLALLAVALNFYLFLFLNPIFIEAFDFWSNAVTTGKISDLENILTYVEQNNPDLITALANHVESKFFFSTFALFTVLLISSMVFFMNVIKLLLIKNLGFFANIKESFKEFKENFLVIVFVTTLALFLANIYTANANISTVELFVTLIFKNFVLVSFFNFLVILSNKDNLIKNKNNDSDKNNNDPYNIEVKD